MGDLARPSRFRDFVAMSMSTDTKALPLGWQISTHACVSTKYSPDMPVLYNQMKNTSNFLHSPTTSRKVCLQPSLLRALWKLVNTGNLKHSSAYNSANGGKLPRPAHFFIPWHVARPPESGINITERLSTVSFRLASVTPVQSL